jgi:hypothetical protein
MKKILIILLTVMVSISFAGTAFSMEEGNKRKGKYTYRKVFKTCYDRGEVDMPKPSVNPDARTQAEWESIFDSKAFDEFPCQQEWSTLSEKDLTDIFTYLHAHASDSPTPAKCK